MDVYIGNTIEGTRTHEKVWRKSGFKTLCRKKHENKEKKQETLFVTRQRNEYVPFLMDNWIDFFISTRKLSQLNVTKMRNVSNI